MSKEKYRTKTNKNLHSKFNEYLREARQEYTKALRLERKLNEQYCDYKKPEEFFMSTRYSRKKTLLLDMDETLIHCVDDIETESPQHIIDIHFEDDEIVPAGINIRPFAYECLKHA